MFSARAITEKISLTVRFVNDQSKEVVKRDALNLGRTNGGARSNVRAVYKRATHLRHMNCHPIGCGKKAIVCAHA
jgi:hypothetical protein